MYVFSSPLHNHKQRLHRLRLVASLFTLCLFAPLSGLLYWGYAQLEASTLNNYKNNANSFIVSTNRKFFKKLTLSNNLSVDDFSYYKPVYNPVEKQLQNSISPLAAIDLSTIEAARNMAGLIGFFQYDDAGRFNSPVWPNFITSNNLSDRPAPPEDAELAARQQLATVLHRITSQSNELTKRRNNGIVAGDGLFKVVHDLNNHLIFYRILPHQETLKLQGYVVERSLYMRQALLELLERNTFEGPVLIALRDTKHTPHSEYFLTHADDNSMSVTVPSEEQITAWQKTPIVEKPLFFPFSGYDITISTYDIPATASMIYTAVGAIVLLALLLAACFGFYRLGVNQLALAEQRLNFVSSVSHELRTPLTSIRMYAEMLKDGSLPSDEYKQEYYHFIFNESERLSRLINNILQLSNVRNQQLCIQPAYLSVTELLDLVRPLMTSVLSEHQFHLNVVLNLTPVQHTKVLIDKDALSQIIINVTDNATKFFDKTRINDKRREVVDFIVHHNESNPQEIQIEIRDYGDGISLEQEEKLFDLFYRGGSELTRTTQGTGIGLALVKELVLAQQGKVHLIRKSPGLAILLTFKAKTEVDSQST